MAWRVIIRFSLNFDQYSVVRNHIANILTPKGIINTTTGTWESVELLDETDAAETLANVIIDLAKAPMINPGTRLDHLWIYLDRH
jgi:hypothetical protein